LSILRRGKWTLLHTPCPPSHVSHAQLDKHISWRPTKFLFGRWCGNHSHTELGNISEISSPRPQSSGKIFFWIVGIQASSPRCPQVPMPLHMPEIKDYRSTLAASKLIILFLEMLKFSKILFLKNNFLWRKVKNLLNYFIFNMKSSILKKLFKRHALELPSYSCNSLHYINIWNWFLW
jgi:hypothetical protein